MLDVHGVLVSAVSLLLQRYGFFQKKIHLSRTKKMDCLLMDEFELKIVQFCKVLRYVFIGDGVVLQVAIQVLLIARHVDESVT